MGNSTEDLTTELGHKGTVCLDFDGVLNTYDGWQGEDELFEPFTDRQGITAQEFVQVLLLLGFEVAVHSTRPADRLVPWLRDHGFLIGHQRFKVVGRKPPAILYVDDRGARFYGDYLAMVAALRHTAPYWKLDAPAEPEPAALDVQVDIDPPHEARVTVPGSGGRRMIVAKIYATKDGLVCNPHEAP